MSVFRHISMHLALAESSTNGAHLLLHLAVSMLEEMRLRTSANSGSGVHRPWVWLKQAINTRLEIIRFIVNIYKYLSWLKIKLRLTQYFWVNFLYCAVLSVKDFRSFNQTSGRDQFIWFVRSHQHTLTHTCWKGYGGSGGG